MKISSILGSVALAGVVTIGGASAAMAADSPSTPAKDPAKVEQRCEK
jgi:hypothetical protein